jgi:DNA polymerase III epsilon subunit-like protein
MNAAKKALKLEPLARVVTEEVALTQFWQYFAICDGRSIGFNHVSFDLPFLVRRSFDLGVRPPFMPNLAKYRSEPSTDLYSLLYNWNWQSSHGLKFVCKRYGIPVLAPDVDGSMVKDMSPVNLVKYGLSDLAATVGLYKRMSGYYFDFNDVLDV